MPTPFAVTSIEVREARVYSLSWFFACFPSLNHIHEVCLLLWLLGIGWTMFLVLFLCFAHANSGEPWYFRPGKLVSPKQEYQLLPRTCASYCLGDELLFWARVHLAQARRSCLSERTWRPLFALFELSPRRKELAWAREPFRLSENWARMCSSAVFPSILGWLSHVWLDYYVKVWIEWFCMYWMVYGLDRISLAWYWYETWKDGWLYLLAWDWYAW